MSDSIQYCQRDRHVRGSFRLRKCGKPAVAQDVNGQWICAAHRGADARVAKQKAEKLHEHEVEMRYRERQMALVARARKAGLECGLAFNRWGTSSISISEKSLTQLLDQIAPKPEVLDIESTADGVTLRFPERG